MDREWKGLLELVSIAIPSHGMEHRKGNRDIREG